MRRQNRPRWVDTPLQQHLSKVFPDFVYEEDGCLAVPELARAMKTNRESIYKWLRKGYLTRGAVERLHDFAVGRYANPPAKEDFAKFMLA